MKIEMGYFLVSGMYFISGIPGDKVSISIPFPNGVYYGEIDSLHIYDVAASDFIPVDKIDKKAVHFSISFDATGEFLLQIFYRLRLLGNKAEYPFYRDLHNENKIEKACFYLIAPTNLDAHRFNYIPKDTIDAGDNIVYYWELFDFSPMENFEFRFRQHQ
jgi:hypothetical protein